MNGAYYQIYSIPKGFVQHKVLALDGLWAIHNSPDNNIVIEPLERAICGKRAIIECSGWSRHSADFLILRARELAAKREYGVFYTCEDFIEDVLGNAPKSPQRDFWIAGIICVGIFAIAARK